MSGGLAVDWWWTFNYGGLLVDCWWMDVQWIAGGLLVDCWWIAGGCWWITGGCPVDVWWIGSGLLVDCWWILNYGECLVNCWWTAGRLLVYYGGEYLDNFITIQQLDNLNHLFDHIISEEIKIILYSESSSSLSNSCSSSIHSKIRLINSNT